MSIKQYVENYASENPQKIFLYYGNEEITFEEFNANINRVAHYFSAAGIKKGDRIALYLPNCPEFLYVWFACAKIGAAMVPVNNAYKAEETSYVLNHSESKMVITNAANLDFILEIEKNCEHISDIISIDTSIAPHVSVLPDVVKELPAREPETKVGGDDIVCILYTSGTTGPPKGCRLPNDYYTLTAEEYIRCCDIHSNDRLITHLPLFHMNAQTTSTMSSIIAKASLILIDRFSASQFWEQIERYKPTLFNYIGAMLSILEELPLSASEKDHNMTRCWGGGAQKDQILRIEERFNLTVLEGYGSTEASIVLQNYYKSRSRKLGSVGLVSLGKEAKIVDEEDNDVPPNTIGEIVVRGTGMMKGYFKEPETTAQAWKGGWFHSGDNGYMDEEGFFYFSDRKKDIIRRSGENISSAEVETVIRSHPKILDVAIIGVPDKIRREEVKAYVILQPEETPKTLPPDEIISFCNERLAYFKVPRYIEYRDQDFPRTPTQRIKKYELKAEKEDLTEGCFDKNISEKK